MKIAIKALLQKLLLLDIVVIVVLKLLTKTAMKVTGKEPLPKPNKNQRKSLAHFFNELAYALESTFRMKEDDEMLRKYQKARDIRNRITHPREPADLDVTPDEYMGILIPAHQWFAETFNKILTQSSLKKSL